ncbi:MAG TPA: S9 family peptidase [Xanthomonadaceae bacterium]|jgi:dipeptidyl aminopeptidase/acylaminoacyl peptidase
MSRKDSWVLAAALWAITPAPASAQSQPAVDVDRYLKKDSFGHVKISPTGAYYAVTVNLPDRSVLWVQQRSDGKVTAKATGGPHSEVADFWWVNDQRLVIAWAKKEGSLEKPQPTGELFGLNADASGAKQLIGHFEKPVKADSVEVYSAQGLQYAELMDTLPRDDKHVLVAVSTYEVNPVTRVVRMDVDDGSTTQVASAPLRRARFVADPDGVVRFAVGSDDGNFSHLLYRPDAKTAWRTLNDEHASGHVESPLGFSADGRTAYLQVENDSGPDAIVAFDTASGQRRDLLRDPVVDPELVLHAGGDEVPVGASFMGDHRHAAFFDEDSDAATHQRSLEAAFPGQSVLVTSRTKDGGLEIVGVDSDTDPGDFYLYDRKAKAADGIFSRRSWIDPKSLSPTRAVTLAARDGMALYGYLTLPKGAGANLPMVVLPHGGPFGIYDDNDFDEETQMLADAGYAVLRINYRGSGNYGRAFLHAGAREWGGRMQDDVSDATRWAIAQKIADPQRVCIYGASYGAYAAMMGLAKEPGLYRCGVGYVGVYDLPMMLRDDAGKADYLKKWSDDWVGTSDSVAAVSPVNLAGKIKQPVFLVAGGKDTTAPIEHTQKLEKALVAAGARPETLYFPTEGHGFYTDEHRHAFYVKLLDFLAANIGGAKAQP